MIARLDLRPAADGASDAVIDLDIRQRTVDGTDRGLRAIIGDEGQPPAAGGAGRPRYRMDDAALLRAPLHSALAIPDWPDLDDRTPDGTDRCRAWIRQVWSDPVLADAVRHASRDLSRELDMACATEAELDADTARRLVLRLGAYALRASRRSTPFGLFAGVAPAYIARTASTRWGDRHVAIARASGVWIADIVARLEAIPELRSQLTLTTNNILVRRGDRLVVPWLVRDLEQDITSTAVPEISLRRTREVQIAVDAATQPVRYHDLVTTVLASVPSLTCGTARTLVDHLICSRVLISNLNPPSTHVDALGYLVDQLEEAGADQVAPAAVMVADLRTIHRLLCDHNQRPVAYSAAVRTVAAARMATLSSTPKPLAVDVRLDADLVLPTTVAREITSAVEALTRISAYPRGTANWHRYAEEFARRYGTQTLVPLLDVIDPHTGLGFPNDYLGSTPQRPAPASARDARLLALAQAAALAGHDEVELTETLIRHLARDGANTMQGPAHLEAAVEIQATSLPDLQSGQFQLVIRAITRAMGTMSGGRWTALLDPFARTGVPAALRNMPTLHPDAMAVQLAYPALRHDGTHITRTPQLLPVISIAEHRPAAPDVIPLSDLAVGKDPSDGGLYLFSLTRRRRLEPTSMHPLHPAAQMPPIARFLSEIGRGHATVVTEFDWGSAAALPFLPRIRHGRTVLSPARWLLPADHLPGPTATTAAWSAAFADVRSQLRIPAHVLMTYWDQRLLLDLNQAGHRALLRSHLERPHLGPITLAESAPTGTHKWLGRPHELVALLRAAPRPVRRQPAPAPRLIHPAPAELPGDTSNLSIRLDARPRAARDITTIHLPRLAERLRTTGLAPRWWFTVDGGHIDLHLKTQTLDATVRTVSAWTAELITAGLLPDHGMSINPHRHDYRWGTDDLLQAAERVATTDTETVLSTPHHPERLDPRVLTAVNLVAIAIALTGNIDQGMQWLTRHAVTDPTPSPQPRPILKQVVRAADPTHDWAALRALPGGNALTAGWTQRHHALTDYGRRLRPHGNPHFDAVLDALLHEHHLRAVGDDPTHERGCRRLARAAACTWQARQLNSQSTEESHAHLQSNASQ